MAGTSNGSAWDVPVALSFAHANYFHSIRLQFNRSRTDVRNLYAGTTDVAGNAGKFIRVLPATVIATNVLQAVLIACVVLWVLDVPRQVLNLSFYTEQLLSVTLGLVLALAFIAETKREPTAFDLGGACAAVAIVVYLIYHYAARHEIAWLAVVALAAAIAWTLTAGRVAIARWFDWASAVASLIFELASARS